MLEPLLCQLNKLRIVLASGSKQRENLLRKTTLKFEVHPSNFEEDLDPKNYTFSEYVTQTALGKVNDVRNQLDNNLPDLIIGVDTMVECDGRWYGKPTTKEMAIETIKTLTQRCLSHTVYSGVVIWYRNKIRTFTELTTVHMMKLNDEEIMAYVDTGEPMGKAGGYGIQGLASSFVKGIDGDVNNVIGLPLCHLVQELKQILSAV